MSGHSGHPIYSTALRCLATKRGMREINRLAMRRMAQSIDLRRTELRRDMSARSAPDQPAGLLPDLHAGSPIMHVTCPYGINSTLGDRSGQQTWLVCALAPPALPPLGNWHDGVSEPMAAGRRERLHLLMTILVSAATIAAVLIIGLLPRRAVSLPLYARQTGQPCATCHTAFLELTPFARRFKLGGYKIGRRGL